MSSFNHGSHTSITCNVCKKIFPTQYSLNFHKVVVSKFCNEYSSIQDKFECAICKKIFVTKSSLKIHTLMSLKCCPKDLRKGINCDYCGKKLLFHYVHKFTEFDENSFDYLIETTLESHYKTCIEKFEIDNNITVPIDESDNTPVEAITDPASLDRVIKTGNGYRIIPFVKASDNIVGVIKLKTKKKKIKIAPKSKDPWD